MVERIADDKNKILEYMGKSLEKYGPDKMDVEEVGKLADAIKDLAEAEKSCWEAEYYRSVTEAMGTQGYMPDNMGYNQYRDSMGRYATRGRRGYSYGYEHDPIQGVRDAMSGATPEQREKMQRELRTMLGM